MEKKIVRRNFFYCRVHTEFIHLFPTPMTDRPKQQRSAISKTSAKQVIVYFNPEVITILDQVARLHDSDRSKLIRKAVSEFISKAI